MYNYEIVVVLYNKGIKDSETLVSLQNARGFLSTDNRVIIWDNSPSSVINCDVALLENLFAPCRVSYFWDGSNSSLSLIYNTIRNNVNSKFTVILDHDTTLPRDFFDILDKVTGSESNKGINLFLPVLCSHEKIISPAYEYRFRHRQLRKMVSGGVDCHHLQAMNSGMVINSSYYRDLFPGYNEELKFYGTDNDFMKKYRAHNQLAYILPTIIDHKSNFREDPLYERVKRFVAIREAAIILAREEGPGWVLFEKIRYFCLSLKYGLQNHSRLFLKSIMKKNKEDGRR